jgi:hypothetical protein
VRRLSESERAAAQGVAIAHPCLEPDAVQEDASCARDGLVPEGEGDVDSIATAG